MTDGNRDPQRHCTVTTTTGWEATCKCGLDDSQNVPCTVLDPFNGSGTTGEVARDCGCHYIGCELNPEYAALAEKRIRDEQREDVDGRNLCAGGKGGDSDPAVEQRERRREVRLVVAAHRRAPGAARA